MRLSLIGPIDPSFAIFLVAKLTKSCRPAHDVQMIGLDQVDDVAHLGLPPADPDRAGRPDGLRGLRGDKGRPTRCAAGRHASCHGRADLR